MTTMPGESHDIGPLSQIPPGEGRNFLVASTRVAVFRTRSGEVYATQPECPHRQGPLADGLMGGATIVCPLHERVYDLRTGDEKGAECRLTTYPARISEAGTIIVTV
jgi:nitrite reductase (NADH) small subunit